MRIIEASRGKRIAAPGRSGLAHTVAPFEIKRFMDDERTITGIATTPATDLMGDIVDPSGAQYKLPLPLLLQHDHGRPIGWVTRANVTSKGIEITAKLAKAKEPGILRDHCDYGWQAIKLGLVNSFSIGFRAIDSKPLAGGGRRFTKWLWIETSLVVVPANPEAVIDQSKAPRGLALFRDGETYMPGDRIKTVGNRIVVAQRRTKLPPWIAPHAWRQE